MTDIVATVQYDDAVTVVSADKEITVSAVGIQGFSATELNLEQAANVDATSLENGSVLVYKTNTNKWTSTRLLDLQTMEGGEF